MARSHDHLRGQSLHTVFGIVAAGLFLGATAAVVLREADAWINPAGAEAAAGTHAKSDANAKAKRAAAAKSTAQPAASAAVPPAAVNAAATKPVESVAVKRLRGSVEKSKGVQAATQVEDQTLYQYNVFGRRDPFEPMVDHFVGADVGGDAPMDVGGVKVVGIVWGADSFALVEDGRGSSQILRRGDKVMNGYVEQLKRDAMVVKLTMDGQSQSVVIPLTRKGDESNASR